MRIGLLDIDNQGKVKRYGATIYPNLALCKISSYHKSIGDDVEWYMPFGDRYDIVYKSKIFNFSPDYDLCINADLVISGGTGYDIKSNLPKDIDDCQPDLSIYPNIPSGVSYGFLTRGCPNKCRWCVVPEKEGAIKPYWDIDRVANGNNKVILMDNNILATGEYCSEQLDKIIERGYRVDFNQALDARLVTDEFAQKLAKVKWIDNRIRFGCDTAQQVKQCQRAIDLICSYGFKGEFFLYTILQGDMEECYTRINYWWEKNRIYRATGVGCAVFAYAQPYRDTHNVNTPPQWQKDMAQWVNKRMLYTTMGFKEFEPRKGFKCSEYFKNNN